MEKNDDDDARSVGDRTISSGVVNKGKKNRIFAEMKIEWNKNHKKLPSCWRVDVRRKVGFICMPFDLRIYIVFDFVENSLGSHQDSMFSSYDRVVHFV